jgi:hypothetical protein
MRINTAKVLGTLTIWAAVFALCALFGSLRILDGFGAGLMFIVGAGLTFIVWIHDK